MLSPGIHRNLPFADYLAHEAISPSGAGKLLRSGRHYRTYRDTPPPVTPAFRQGGYAHALSLEGPEAAAERFAVQPEGIDRRTKQGKAAAAAFEAEAAGKIILTAAEAAPVAGMAAAVAAHPLIPALLEGAEVELSMIWTDPATAAPCKGRADAARLADGVFLDLKTTLDASPAAFARAALNYGYHVQAAAYTAGAAVLGFEVRDFLVLCVEKTPPFCCAVYRLPDAALELGAKRWADACRAYAECLERGTWPGYPEGITELVLPGWAMSEFYQEEAE